RGRQSLDWTLLSEDAYGPAHVRHRIADAHERTHRHDYAGLRHPRLEHTMTDNSASPDTPAEEPRTPDTDDAKLAVRVMGDRIMCAVPNAEDRRSKAGIIIPATAKTADRRGLWGTVTEVGPLVRNIQVDDRI